ncbi:MAG: hypothetical protein BroJett040_23650 [Oligoflexia bacterium]|nr:MAG: hypothetical protein BroJett040_23650 [Oligoflexia bacterium]
MNQAKVLLLISIQAITLSLDCRANIQSSTPFLSRIEELRDLYADYNKRFDQFGRYRSDEQQIHNFNLKQDAFVERWKALGAMNEVLLVENDYQKDLWVRLNVLQDEMGNLIGFFYEKGKYYDDEERSYLRAISLNALVKGIGFVPVMKAPALVVKGFYFAPEVGGTLQFQYLQDFSANSWGVAHLFCRKINGMWILQDEKYQQIRRAFIRTWTRWLPPNGGVRDIQLTY